MNQGYTYVRSGIPVPGKPTYWECPRLRKKLCTTRAVTTGSGENVFVVKVGEHQHPPDRDASSGVDSARSHDVHDSKLQNQMSSWATSSKRSFEQARTFMPKFRTPAASSTFVSRFIAKCKMSAYRRSTTVPIGWCLYYYNLNNKRHLNNSKTLYFGL